MSVVVVYILEDSYLSANLGVQDRSLNWNWVSCFQLVLKYHGVNLDILANPDLKAWSKTFKSLEMS